ncbi:MAG: exo-alpha-sialidase, partial [Armatimonadota bacterium]
MKKYSCYTRLITLAIERWLPMNTCLVRILIIPFCTFLRQERLCVLFTLLFSFILCGPYSAQADETGLHHVTVFTSGEAGYHTIRIPALEVAPDGTLLAFAEGRRNSIADPGEPGQEIDLLLKTSRDGGRTWSPVRVVEHAGPQWSSANPATVVDKTTGRIWIFYIRCAPGANTHSARPGSRDVLNLVRFSDDNGKHWSEPVDLTPIARDMADKEWGISVPGPGGGVQISSGRLVI